jgi:hypothetical protein
VAEHRSDERITKPPDAGILSPSVRGRNLRRATEETGPQVFDVDGDARLDLGVGDFRGRFLLRDPTWPGDATQACVTDFDRDGDLDDLVGDKPRNSHGRVWLFRRK